MPVIIVIVGIAIIGGAFFLTRSTTEQPGELNFDIPEPDPITEVRNEDIEPDEPEVAEDEQEDDDDEDDPVEAEEENEEVSEPAAADPETAYIDGTYDNQLEYKVPGNRTEGMEVSLTIVNDIVTDTTVAFEGDIGTSRLYQAKFKDAFKSEVIGVPLDDIDLVRVGGASLSTKGFNEAVANIQAKAAS